VIYQNVSDTALLLFVPEHHDKLVVVKYRNVSGSMKTICSRAVLLRQNSTLATGQKELVGCCTFWMKKFMQSLRKGCTCDSSL